MANFDSEFFGLVFPGLQATQKIHAQNSRPELSAFLSNFTLSNPKFSHGDFLLTGETNLSREGWPKFRRKRDWHEPPSYCYGPSCSLLISADARCSCSSGSPFFLFSLSLSKTQSLASLSLLCALPRRGSTSKLLASNLKD